MDAPTALAAPPLHTEMRTKVDPGPPSPEEQKILDLLESEYAEADAAAKASARFEVAVHQRFVDARIAQGYPPEEAGNIDRVFRASEFDAAFRNLLTLRIQRRIIGHLQLDDYADPIMAQLIASLGPKRASGAGTKSVAVDDSGKIFYGDEDAYLEQQQRDAARKRAGR